MDATTGTEEALFTEALFTEALFTGADASHLILAHGFTQNTRCWGDFADLLAARHNLTLVDLPGHGRSGHDDADLGQAADLLQAAGRGVLLGYSMGGRIALHAAIAETQAGSDPDERTVEALVLIGATAGIVDQQARVQRSESDHALASDIDATGTEAFIDRWLRTPLLKDLTPDQQHREARLTNRSAGLAASLRNCGTGTQEPLHEQLANLSIPVLCIAGERDDKFRAESKILVDAIGTNASTAAIEDAGHACHLEAPERTAEVVLNWLSDQSPSRR